MLPDYIISILLVKTKIPNINLNYYLINLAKSAREIIPTTSPFLVVITAIEYSRRCTNLSTGYDCDFLPVKTSSNLVLCINQSSINLLVNSCSNPDGSTPSYRITHFTGKISKWGFIPVSANSRWEHTLL